MVDWIWISNMLLSMRQVSYLKKYSTHDSFFSRFGWTFSDLQVPIALKVLFVFWQWLERCIVFCNRANDILWQLGGLMAHGASDVFGWVSSGWCSWCSVWMESCMILNLEGYQREIEVLVVTGDDHEERQNEEILGVLDHGESSLI